jgi:hypothetical protein
MYVLHTRRLPNCGGRPLGGAAGHLGARVVCMRDIFILEEIWVQGKIYLYILVGTLLGWNIKFSLFYNSNFTQVYVNLEKCIIHYLTYVISVYLNLFVWREREVHEIF